jgi:hypothetical protein
MLQERLLDPECVIPQVPVSFAEVTKSCGSACYKNPESGIDQNSHLRLPPYNICNSSAKQLSQGSSNCGGQLNLTTKQIAVAGFCSFFPRVASLSVEQNRQDDERPNRED